jgi:hypothetical protein
MGAEKFIHKFYRELEGNKRFVMYTYKLEGNIETGIERILFSVLDVFTLQRLWRDTLLRTS